jgi:hypothetical protein
MLALATARASEALVIPLVGKADNGVSRYVPLGSFPRDNEGHSLHEVEL